MFSVGLMGSGRNPPVEAMAVASERGVDLGPHRSSLFSLRLASSASLVVVMGPGQRAEVARDFGVEKKRILILGDLDPETPKRRTVLDPLGLPLEAFEETYDQIDRCLGRLTMILGGIS